MARGIEKANRDRKATRKWSPPVGCQQAATTILRAPALATFAGDLATNGLSPTPTPKMHDPESYLSDILIFYGRFYAPQIVLVAALSAITIYRRELSSNHVYAEEDDDDAEKKEDDEGGTSLSETATVAPSGCNKKTDEVLDGGTPLLPLILSILSLFHLQQRQQQKHENPAETAEDADQSNKTDGKIDENLVSSLLPLKHNVSAGDLLELAGNFYCCEPVASLILQKPMHVPIPRAKQILHEPAKSLTASENNKPKENRFDDMLGLPADAWIHVMGFLRPQDVTSFACTSRHCREWVEQGETSQLLWKALWQRDYGWVLQHWTIGRRAAARSRSSNPSLLQQTKSHQWQRADFLPHVSKRTYIWFQLCFLDYVLAGCNSLEQCLVGIAGHVYDLSLFLLSHPGSPETVMAHAGQDATEFFHHIGHSKGARKLAQSMCVLVDPSRLGGDVGVRPTSHTRFELSAAGTEGSDDDNDSSLCVPPPPPPATPPDESVLTRHHHPSTCSTLETIKAEYKEQQRKHQAAALRRCSGLSTLTQPKVFYDPLAQRWKAWYMDPNMENVFVENLG